MRPKLMPALLIAVVLLALSGVALAHHTSAGLFSTSVSKTLTGTVQRFLYVNPHAALVLDVRNEAGVVETWRVEFTSPGGLRSCCQITRNTFKQGDTVTVYGHPYFNNIKTLDAVRVTDAAGKEYAVRSSDTPEYETNR